MDELKKDILAIENLLEKGSTNHIALVEYYNEKTKKDQASIERVLQRLNIWVKRLVEILHYGKSAIKDNLNRDEKYFLIFAEKIRLCMNNLTRILAEDGELYRLVSEQVFVLDTAKIKAKIDEALGNERSPGLRTLIILFKQLGNLEKRLDEYSVESHIGNMVRRIDAQAAAGQRSVMTMDEKTMELHKFQKILEQNKEAQNRIVTERVRSICLLFSGKLRLGVPHNEFPRANVDIHLSPKGVYQCGWGLNNIVFRSVQDSLDGEVIGEETSHFFREFLKPKNEKKEMNTHEFFGFLGRRILYELLLDIAERNLFFKATPTQGKSRIQVLAASSKYFNEKRREQRVEPALIASRKDALEHFRGYRFAERVELVRIHNWHKLYSLPNQEVRMRFFREYQDYLEL